jgi:NAD(P)-dependent dehydrogenase (short-subunit alcohol dehydrogenase family)
MRPLTEQTILITGATDGLGRYLAENLAAEGAHVIAHGRNAERAELVRKATGDRADVVLADLADLRDVDRLAEEVRGRYDRIDVLVNNAGVGSGPPGRVESADGIELRFAVNYLAGYRLTRSLLPLLVASAPSRVVNVASLGQYPIDFADPLLEHAFDGGRAYAQSKLAQIMFTVDLAEELRDRDVTVNALHPATYMDTTMVRTGGIRPTSTIEQGGLATLRLIRDAALDNVTGRFFNGQTEATPNPQAFDATARRRLHDLSDDLITHALRD